MSTTVALSSATVAISSAFAFQGQLDVDNVAADGQYDFVVHLFDADVSGSEVTTEETVNSVEVSAGIFNLELDFGYDAFGGGSRWLEIEVSPAGANTFQTIAPRTRVSPTPIALGLPYVYANPSSAFVGIGSTEKVSSSTLFQVNSDVTNTWGGMYVATSGAAGSPFYGYSVDGSTANAWHQFNGGQNAWQLVIGGSIRVDVTSTSTALKGNVRGEAGTDGLVKAAATVICGSGGSNVQYSFNNVGSLSSVTVSAGLVAGACTLDFDFDVSARYWTVTAPGAGARIASCELGALDDQLDCLRSDHSGIGFDGQIMVLVY